MKPSICFTTLDGRLKAVVNYRVRTKPSDVAIMRNLDTREMRVYTGMRDDGETETAIFDTLFPQLAADDQSDVWTDLDKLNKKQLICVIIDALQTTLPSLGRMSATDLRALARELCARKRMPVLGDGEA